MKKIFLLMIAAIAILAVSCEKDNGGRLGAVTQNVEGMTGNTLNVAGRQDKTVEIPLDGITGGLTVSVRGEDAHWLAAVANNAKDGIVVTVRGGYVGEADRLGIITVESGKDRIQIQVVQKSIGGMPQMVILNEGQYGYGTAELSVVNYDGTVTWNAFEKANNMPLGDVGQSITYLDGKYFVVLGNSNQIKVVDPLTMKLLGTIDFTAPSSPCFIVPLNDTEAIVSDYNQKLTKINYKNYTVVENIDLSGAPSFFYINKMTRVGDKIFCAAIGSDAVWVYDCNNFTPLSPRAIPVEGMEDTEKMIEDRNGNLWVYGSYGPDGYPKLYCIDTDTEQVVYSYEVPVVQPGDAEKYVAGAAVDKISYNRMDTDGTRGKLYFLMKTLLDAATDRSVDAVYSFDVDTHELKEYCRLPELGMMYGMGISPDGGVYLLDCLDYSAQRGYAKHYKPDGSHTDLRVGIFPSMIHFTEYEN